MPRGRAPAGRQAPPSGRALGGAGAAFFSGVWVDVASGVVVLDPGHPQAMVANATELRGLLQAPLQTRITAEWVRDLEAADILAAPILTIDEAIDLPQVAHNQMIVDTRDGNRHIGVPVKLSGTPGSVESAPPRIGEHTSEVLQELGLNKVETDQLIETGAIAQENGSNR